jgi:O-acetyl-ADP-ribose deacetylase (regulator of RNase III)
VPPRIRVDEGDISTFQGDAVVNAANNHLVMGAGVAGAIARRGGASIQAECDDFVRRNGPLAVGEAAMTGAGDLPARTVIHAATMGDEPASVASVRSSTRETLRIAADAGIRSIAFPVLGAGIGGVPFADAVGGMLIEIRAHGEHRNLPETVVLYGYTTDQADELRRLLESS